MKKSLFLFLCLALFVTVAAGQHKNNKPDRHHGDDRYHNAPPRFATTDDGVRILLLPDGTWRIARQQEPPVRLPVRTSEIMGGYLYIKEEGKETSTLRVESNTSYDSKNSCYIGSFSFGTAAYTFNGKDNTVRFLGDKVIGKTNRTGDAAYMAAYHFTQEIYGDLVSEIMGGYLYIKRGKQEVDAVRVNYNSWYDSKSNCYMGSVSFGTAIYQFDGTDHTVRIMGDRIVGYAIAPSDARMVAAYHYTQEHYGGLCYEP